MSIKKDILWRVYLSFFIILLVAVAIGVQAFRIQTFEGSQWRNLADSLTTAFKTIPAERGNIFSEDDRLLATSMPFFEIRMDVNSTALSDDDFNAGVDSLALCMAEYFNDRTKSEYKEKLIRARKNGERYLLIKRKLTFPQLQVVKQWPLFRKGRYKGGFIIIQKNKRQKPFGMLAHRTIGYVRTGPGAQSVGLESYFNDRLSGKDGQRLMQRLSGGAWMPVNDKNEVEPKNGHDLITTIDVNIQDVAENALLKALQKHNADHGCVVVMEVSTGRIKAIANLGNNEMPRYWEEYNYAVGEATEPGSTFKLATMMALLEDGKITLEDSVDLRYGKTYYYGQVMRDAEPHNYRKVTIGRAFEISSNAGVSRLAHQHYAHEPEKFIDRLTSFHLRDKTGIEIAGEPSPMIKSPADPGWSGISVPWMSVGYEVLLTPLQILTFYNAVANNGVMVKPSLVSEVREYGKTIERFPPVVVDEQICSPETIEKLHTLLKGVIEDGTARRLKHTPYKIAGKTGTAQIASDGGYEKVYQSSFVGFFPADDPKYSCIVVVNKPSKGSFYGSAVAGPVFQEVADKIYASAWDMHQAVNRDSVLPETFDRSISGYQHDLKTIYSGLEMSYAPMSDQEWVSVDYQVDTLIFQPLSVLQKKIPSVKGMGLRDALYLLENMGLSVRVRGRGKVTYQSLPAGTPFQQGDEIKLLLE